MNRPIPACAIHPLRFEDRLLRVQAVVQERIQCEQKANINHLRARLWVQWLKKNALDLPVKREVQA